MNKVAVYTTIAPPMLPFVPEFLRSIESQTDRDFDLWVGVDDVAMPAGMIQSFGRRLEVVRAKPGDSPAVIRERAWRKIVERYEVLVVVDSDDVAEPTRVEAGRRGGRI